MERELKMGIELLNKNVRKVRSVMLLRSLLLCSPNSHLDRHIGFISEYGDKISSIGKILLGIPDQKQRIRHLLSFSLTRLKNYVSSPKLLPSGFNGKKFFQICLKEESTLQKEKDYPLHENHPGYLPDALLPNWYRELLYQQAVNSKEFKKFLTQTKRKIPEKPSDMK